MVCTYIICADIHRNCRVHRWRIIHNRVDWWWVALPADSDFIYGRKNCWCTPFRWSSLPCLWYSTGRCSRWGHCEKLLSLRSQIGIEMSVWRRWFRNCIVLEFGRYFGLDMGDGSIWIELVEFLSLLVCISRRDHVETSIKKENQLRNGKVIR